MKVEVKFVDFVFTYSLVPLAKQQIEAEIKAVLEKDLCYSNPEDEDPGPYLVRFSKTECDLFEQNAVQVHSKSSLIIRNYNSMKYWKYSPNYSSAFSTLLGKSSMRVQTCRGLLQYSLLPS